MDVAFGPRRAVPFLDRVGERQRIFRLLEKRRAERRPLLVFLHGQDGMGRASLASECYYQDSSNFGDYLEVSARQPDGRLVSQGEMLGQALRGLGLADTELPTSDEARADHFQRLALGRRFLLLIRDVVAAEQVAALIPTSAPDAAVVVTTRVMLRELMQNHDFVDIRLTGLPEADSQRLLAERLDETAGEIQAELVAELAELADGSPLQIRILAAQLVSRAHRVRRVVEELRSSESALLTMDHSQKLARSLDVAYEVMDRRLQTAHLRISSLPGRSFDTSAAVVALDVGEREAEDLLDQLVDANLLVFEPATHRYSSYRVVRADARRRAREIDGEAVSATLSRLVHWYLREAVPRDAGLSDRWRVGPVFEQLADVAPVARAVATAWFAEEWPALVECVTVAHEAGMHDLAWQLCVVLFKYLHMHGHVDPWLESHRLGVLSAEAAGDLVGLMQVISQRGAANLALGEHALARSDFLVSLDAAVRSGHVLGEQSALEWLGKVAAASGDLDEAMERYDQSEAVIDRAGAMITGAQRSRMRALLTLHRARVWLLRKVWHRAAALAEQGERQFASTGESENQAKCLMVLGKAAHGADDHSEGARCFRAAAELFKEDRAVRAYADSQRWLGDALAADEQVDAAIEAYAAARESYVKLGDAGADLVSARIIELNR